MMAKTSPTACRETTPSRNRAPPECHRPMTGQPSARARSYATRIALQPASPIAPPWMVASEQNATDVAPSIRPIAASIPESSSSVMSSTVPGSKSIPSRVSGLRGSSALSTTTFGVVAATLMPARS